MSGSIINLDELDSDKTKLTTSKEKSSKVKNNKVSPTPENKEEEKVNSLFAIVRFHPKYVRCICH